MRVIAHWFHVQGWKDVPFAVRLDVVVEQIVGQNLFESDEPLDPIAKDAHLHVRQRR